MTSSSDVELPAVFERPASQSILVERCSDPDCLQHASDFRALGNQFDEWIGGRFGAYWLPAGFDPILGALRLGVLALVRAPRRAYGQEESRAAGSWAFLMFVPASMLFWGSVDDPYSARTSANAAIIAEIQAAVIFASIKAYLSMERRRSDFYILIPRLGVALFVLGCLAAFLLWGREARY